MDGPDESRSKQPVQNVQRGLWNSSITRVRPVFTQLLQRDPSGSDWLTKLVNCAPNRDCLDRSNEGKYTILPRCTVPRAFQDRILKGFGIQTIDLPACFERDLAPSAAFLRWLVLNPHLMTWPMKGGQRKRYKRETQVPRERLFGMRECGAQAKVQEQALDEIAKEGALRSKGKWWAFEGFTSVDYCIETNDFVLLIEGKRTEQLSKSTEWYPIRNQLIRNLEAASEIAQGKNYALLLVVELEADIPPISRISQMIVESLPHLCSNARFCLAAHYLGATTWRRVCEATGVLFSQLPRTAIDVVRTTRPLLQNPSG
jgi:hypothetical protein